MTHYYYITFVASRGYLVEAGSDKPLKKMSIPDIRFKPIEKYRHYTFYDTNGFVPIYNTNIFFNRLLSLCVCFDLMPDRSADFLFNDNMNGFRYFYKYLKEMANELFI